MTKPRSFRRLARPCAAAALLLGLVPGLRAAEPAVGALTLEPTATLATPGWLARAEAANRRQAQDATLAGQTQARDTEFLALLETPANEAPATLAEDARPAPSIASDSTPPAPVPAVRRWQAADFAVPAAARTTGPAPGTSSPGHPAPAINVQSPAAGVFAVANPNVIPGRTVAVRRAALPAVPAGAFTLVNTGPLPASQVGLSALTTTDQQNTTGGNSASATAPQGIGQSFTPTQSTMNAVTLPLYAYNGASTTVQLQVFVGGGFTGTLLATGTPVTFTNSAFQTVELTLATPLTLTPGSLYTFRANVTAGTYFYSYSTTDVYAGGNRYTSATGTAQTTSDLVFAEGFDSSVGVPEPGTWAGGALLVGAAGWSLRRRLRRAG